MYLLCIINNQLSVTGIESGAGMSDETLRVESADGGMVVDCLVLILCCTWKRTCWTHSLN